MKKMIHYLKGIKRILIPFKGKNTHVNFNTKIRGRKHILMNNNSKILGGCKINIENGRLELEDNSYLGENVRVNIKEGTLLLGKNSFINNDCEIIALGKISIGKDVLIGPKTLLISGNHCFNNKILPINMQGYSIGNIEIKDNVWIGAGCIILNKVVIEEGAIVAAGSVLTKSIGKNEIWGGNPAKFIKYR